MEKETTTVGVALEVRLRNGKSVKLQPDGQVLLRSQDGSTALIVGNALINIGESIQCLFANGNVSTKEGREGWIYSHSDGSIVSRKVDGTEEKQEEELFIASEIDPDSGDKCTTRSDGVIKIESKEHNKVLVQHKDGTTITTCNDSTEFKRADLLKVGMVRDPHRRHGAFSPGQKDVSENFGDRAKDGSMTRVDLDGENFLATWVEVKVGNQSQVEDTR